MVYRRLMALSTRITQQFLRDRRTLALLFLGPLFILTLLTPILSSSAATTTLALAPGDTLSATIAQQVAQHLSGSVGITLRIVTPAQGRSLLHNGDVDGVLAFPANFAEQVQQTRQATLTLQLEGSNPAVVKELLGVTSLLLGEMSQTTDMPASAPLSLTLAPPSYLAGGPNFTQTDALAPYLIGFFVYFLIFMLTAVAFQRERTQGTMERLMVSPLRRTELVLGYLIGFLRFALAQALVVLLYVLFVLQVHVRGGIGWLFLVLVVLTVGAVNLGIFTSAFARNETEIGQFIPLFIVPQLLLGGLFFPIKTLPVALHQLAYLFPLTYANFALKDIMINGNGIKTIWPDFVVLLGWALLLAGAAAITLRRERI
jgi:ABC-2 type transport system permease protein